MPNRLTISRGEPVVLFKLVGNADVAKEESLLRIAELLVADIFTFVGTAYCRSLAPAETLVRSKFE